jgi:hypothetical protein
MPSQQQPGLQEAIEPPSLSAARILQKLGLNHGKNGRRIGQRRAERGPEERRRRAIDRRGCADAGYGRLGAPAAALHSLHLRNSRHSMRFF